MLILSGTVYPCLKVRCKGTDFQRKKMATTEINKILTKN